MSVTKCTKIKVLMYHRLVESRPESEPNWHYITVDAFRKQMQILDSLNYTPITFTDYRLYLEEKLTLPDKPIILTFDDGYLDTYELAVPILLEMNMRAVIFVLGDRNIRNGYWDSDNKNESGKLMSDDQIVRLRSLGFEIGAHSMNHVALSDLSSEEIHSELAGAKESIESLLKEPVDSVSYPFGRIDDRVIRIAAASGYQFGCGVYTGPPGFGENPYDIRRLAINQHQSLAGFMVRIVTPYHYLEWLYHRIRQMSMPAEREIEKAPSVSAEYEEPTHRDHQLQR